MTASSGRPSQVSDDFWIYAEDPDQPFIEDDPATTAVGKRQLFVPRQRVDDAWFSVAELVRWGQLGPSAKVAIGLLDLPRGRSGISDNAYPLSRLLRTY